MSRYCAVLYQTGPELVPAFWDESILHTLTHPDQSGWPLLVVRPFEYEYVI